MYLNNMDHYCLNVAIDTICEKTGVSRNKARKMISYAIGEYAFDDFVIDICRKDGVYINEET